MWLTSASVTIVQKENSQYMCIYIYVYTCVYINICIDIRSLCVYIIFIYIHSCEFACLLPFKKGNTNQGLQAGSHPVCRLLPERVGTAGIAAHGRAVPLEHPPAMGEWDPWTGIDQENSMAKYLILSARRVTKKKADVFFCFLPSKNVGEPDVWRPFQLHNSTFVQRPGLGGPGSSE